MIETILFWFFSVMGIIGGIGMVLNRNPIYSVLLLILNFFCIGGLFLTLNSEFLAAIQIIVYAGAIMVLFLFVIMLLNLEKEPKSNPLDLKRIVSYSLGLVIFVELLYALKSISGVHSNKVEHFEHGKVEPIGRYLMTDYVFGFEMISVILLVAIMGAIIIAKKQANLNR